MAISRLNYTGRRKLKRQDTRIYLRKGEGNCLGFDALLNLSSYNLPGDGRVYVEAYRQTTWMRFDFGSVDRVAPPQDCLLSAFGFGDAVLFRVKVTAGSVRHGVLLAEGDRIRASLSQEEETNRTPLLPVISDPGLGQQIFRVSYDDERTVLCINQQLDWHSLARNQVFVSLVYPEVFRAILTRILCLERHTDTDDLEDWRSQWLRFATLLPTVGCVPDIEDMENLTDWIDAAVVAFAKNHRILDEFVKRWHEESDYAT